MDIFKLIFEHDLRLDQLRERQTDRSKQETGSSLEDFMKPDPTYSKFYFSGTDLENNRFGLNCLQKFDEVLAAIHKALESWNLFSENGQTSLAAFLESGEIGEPVICSKNDTGSWNFNALSIDDESNIGHKKNELAEVLQSGDLVLYKEYAHQGFDLHLFSRDNLYPALFYPLRSVIGPDFRFFSINGKRIRSEQKFYFETWTLDRPPHGAEEVFPDTEI